MGKVMDPHVRAALNMARWALAAAIGAVPIAISACAAFHGG